MSFVQKVVRWLETLKTQFTERMATAKPITAMTRKRQFIHVHTFQPVLDLRRGPAHIPQAISIIVCDNSSFTWATAIIAGGVV